MKNLWENISSTKLSMLIMLIYIGIIGTATFIEEKYDTTTAKLLIYEAKWFECIMLGFIILFIFNIVRSKLFSKRKVHSLIFHISFIFIIIGGGISRYFGYEANMHIFEGETVNEIYIQDPYFQIRLKGDSTIYSGSRPLYFSQIQKNDFNYNFVLPESEQLDIKFNEYIFNSEETIELNIPNGEKILELLVLEDLKTNSLYIREGESVKIGGIKVSFGIPEKSNDINIFEKNGKFLIKTPGDLSYTCDDRLSAETFIDNDSIVELEKDCWYKYKDETFLLKNNYTNAKLKYKKNFLDETEKDVLISTVSYNNRDYEIPLEYNHSHYIQKFKRFNLDDLQIEFAYGPKPIKLPFSLILEEFVLSKYPGTDIPSASKSLVELYDPRGNVKEKHTIEKNKVLDYKGYRFFQTSYDDDEKGTILSVNFDYYGTRITYLGYILMVLGALMVLVSKNSYFSEINQKIKSVKDKRKSITTGIILFFIWGSGIFAQSSTSTAINKEHSNKFGHLIVQTYDGRFSSVHSLALDVIHKLSGKEHFNLPGKGKMDEMQVFLDILTHPDFWKDQDVILVKERSLQNLLGISNKHASYNIFFNDKKQYKLEELAKNAFQKKASEQTTLDREILNVTDRVNIFTMALNGTLLKIFPVSGSENNNWVSWRDSIAFEPVSKNLAILNDYFQVSDLNYANIMRSYLISTIYARESNDYKIPDEITGYIQQIQRSITPQELLPSERKIRWEVYYNKLNIFKQLKSIFTPLGFILLILVFAQNLKIKQSRIINKSAFYISVLILIAFAYQTFGMALRWYLGGHAPWSNGYEVLLLVAWGGLLAGIYASRQSKIALATTAILAGIVLMIAGLSYYDPQLTNLNPVLKSYWLIIHVAIITIGYGFLSLGFLLSLILLILFLLPLKQKEKIVSLLIEELTLINHKLLTIGMFLTAIGTYIGCVWANESWGTYWSWNAKQTWSLIIILSYGTVLHFRLIPGWKSALMFNLGSIAAYGSVIMTFVGVNYYFTKGLHSYASDDPPIFPLQAWITISLILGLMICALIKYIIKHRRISR